MNDLREIGRARLCSPGESAIAMTQFIIACTSRCRSEIFTRLQNRIKAENGQSAQSRVEDERVRFFEGRTSADSGEIKQQKSEQIA